MADSEDCFGIALSFTIDDKDYTKQLDQALREIVRERNELIHKRLIRLDPRSMESCQELIGELEDQRARIKPQFEALSAIYLSLVEYLGELKDYVESGSFADDFQRLHEE